MLSPGPRRVVVGSDVLLHLRLPLRLPQSASKGSRGSLARQTFLWCIVCRGAVTSELPTSLPFCLSRTMQLPALISGSILS